MHYIQKEIGFKWRTPFTLRFCKAIKRLYQKFGKNYPLRHLYSLIHLASRDSNR